MTSRIREHRERLEWSQEKLAEEAELSGGARISDIEKGKGNPSLKTLKAIAGALRVHLLDLFEDDRLTPSEKDLFERLRNLSTTKKKALLDLMDQ